MRLFPSAIRRTGLLVALLCVTALAGGCAKAPLVGKGTLHVTLVAAADCNSCGKASGYPLTYRVLQVTDASPINGASLTQLWDKEEKMLGPALLKKAEAVINPGQTRELPLQREKGATAMIIVGSFCKTKGTCWYYVQPLANGGSVKLSAGSNCFSAAKNP